MTARPQRRLAAAGLTMLVLAFAAIAGGASPAHAHRLGQRALKLGMHGNDVRALQKGLTRLKHPARADGRFGKGTRRILVGLEKAYGWRPVDGRLSRVEGKRMRGLLNEQRTRKLARKRKAAGGYTFPIPGGHDFGGSQSRFGAGRSGHSHQGQDVFAPCGSRLLAAGPGRIEAKAYQAGGAGYYLVVHGRDGWDFVYMHMKKASWAKQGQHLYSGQQIGRVGDTGNASGCHLHFEMWKAPGWYSGGKPVDPLPYLKTWDEYS